VYYSKVKSIMKATLCLCVGLMTLLGTQNVEASDEKVVYRLKWLINASVAGDIYASSQELFKKEGLDVEVKPGGPERDAIRELELGYAQFGVASADQVIRAVEKGASVVVVAQLFQVNPLQWIYRADGVSLSSLEDLKGKKVGITYGGNDETIMRALLAKANIKEDELELASVRYDYTPFLRKKVEVWPVYRNTQGIFLGDKLNAEGEKVGFFNPADFGIQFVANSVVTSEKLLKENPEVVKKFVKALLAGWEAAVAPANMKKSIEAIAKHDEDSGLEAIGRQLEATTMMVKPASDFPIGKIDTEAWVQTEKIMVEQKLIDKPVDIIQRLKPVL
jgi:NitT/TauT family transport system substrate-binding protein